MPRYRSRDAMDERKKTKAVSPSFGERADRELILRMRAGDERAAGEFIDRFRDMLHDEARRCGVQAALCDEVAFDCLADTALFLMRYTTAIPHSLPGYLCTALRNEVHNARRAELLDTEHRLNAAWDDPPDAPYAVIREAVSEYSLRSGNTDDDEAPISPALMRLYVALEPTLTENELRILGWIGHWIPQSRIAEWLGVSYGSLRIRVMRLRDRLHTTTNTYAITVDTADQGVLRAFFRRASIRDGPDRKGDVGVTSGDGGATVGESEQEEDER